MLGIETIFDSFPQFILVCLILAAAEAVYVLLEFGAGLISVGAMALLLPELQDAVVLLLLVNLPAELWVVRSSWRRGQCHRLSGSLSRNGPRVAASVSELRSVIVANCATLWHMKFISVRELRNRPGGVWKELGEGELVLTANGKPVGVLIGVPEGDLEQTLAVLRRSRAALAVSRMREHAAEAGLDQLDKTEIESEIRAARRAAGRR